MVMTSVLPTHAVTCLGKACSSFWPISYFAHFGRSGNGSAVVVALAAGAAAAGVPGAPPTTVAPLAPSGPPWSGPALRDFGLSQAARARRAAPRIANGTGEVRMGLKGPAEGSRLGNSALRLCAATA